ncbi:hypothetical protein VTL71DRAFT_4038, partial [Oculimacula yallundae]
MSTFTKYVMGSIIDRNSVLFSDWDEPTLNRVINEDNAEVAATRATLTEPLASFRASSHNSTNCAVISNQKSDSGTRKRAL